MVNRGSCGYNNITGADIPQVVKKTLVIVRDGRDRQGTRRTLIFIKVALLLIHNIFAEQLWQTMKNG
jgi:hypothetical protein